jgi:hypothetical protein
MSIFTKVYEKAIKKGLLPIFLFVIFLVLTAIFNLLYFIVQGSLELTPTIVSLLVTAFIWLGLRETT